MRQLVGGDDQVGLEALLLDQVLPAHSIAVLLHDGEGEVDSVLAAVAELLEDASGRDHAGSSALLVAGSASPDLAVPYVAAEGVEGPVGQVADLDRVDVCVEGELLGPISNAADDASKTVDAHFVEACLLAQLHDEPAHVLLLRGVALGPDELAEVLGRVVAVLLGHLSDLISDFHIRLSIVSLHQELIVSTLFHTRRATLAASAYILSTSIPGNVRPS